MIEGYVKSLRTLWSKIDSFNSEIPPYLDKAIRKFIIEKLELPEISFKKVYPSFERLTVNKTLPNNSNERIKKVKYLHNPPPKFINSYGRANLKNESIFYATFLTPTAINELNPVAGDLYTISRWKLLNPQKSLHVYPIFKLENVDTYKELESTGLFEKTKEAELSSLYDNLLNKFSKPEQKMIVELNKFIANCFSRKIDENSQYIITACLASKLLYQMFDGTLEAITYPSVQDSIGVDNIAIKPSVLRSKYALTEVREYRMLKNLEDEKASELINNSKKFIGGKINW